MEIRCVYTEGNQNVIQEAVDRLPSGGGNRAAPQLEKRGNLIQCYRETVSEEGCVIHFSSCMGVDLPPAFTLGRRGMLQIIRRYLRGRL